MESENEHKELIILNGGGKPRYSVITPVFNREDCIERCIQSVADNLKWCGAAEHIIVDDGSSDATPQIVARQAQLHQHIKYIKFEKNRGTNAARNAAIAAAQGEYGIILDSDDHFASNALQTIDKVVCKNDFKHYLFAADDLLPKHEANMLLKGHYQRVVTFADFLSLCLNVGFIHVIKTTTLQKHPFDEQLRIHEGPFFLMFFKEAQRILYTKEIVTIRERGRSDSVTYDTLRTSKAVIRNNIIVNELHLRWFLDDYVALGLTHVLRRHYLALIDNHLLLSHYADARQSMAELTKCGGKVPGLQRLVYALRIGQPYRMALKAYMILKYKVGKKRLQ